jgi:hypothetical protein
LLHQLQTDPNEMLSTITTIQKPLLFLKKINKSINDNSVNSFVNTPSSQRVFFASYLRVLDHSNYVQLLEECDIQHLMMSKI